MTMHSRFKFRPSGVVLPLILRPAVADPKQANKSIDDNNGAGASKNGREPSNDKHDQSQSHAKAQQSVTTKEELGVKPKDAAAKSSVTSTHSKQGGGDVDTDAEPPKTSSADKTNPTSDPRASLSREQAQLLTTGADTDEHADADADDNKCTSTRGHPNDAGEDDDNARNRIFTRADLEHRIRTAVSAIANIQTQLIRGEELYHEESSGHGNIYRGWDTIVDAKDMNNGGSTSQGFMGTNVSGRRIPASSRWFSRSHAALTDTEVNHALATASTSRKASDSAVPQSHRNGAKDASATQPNAHAAVSDASSSAGPSSAAAAAEPTGSTRRATPTAQKMATKAHAGGAPDAAKSTQKAEVTASSAKAATITTKTKARSDESSSADITGTNPRPNKRQKSVDPASNNT